MIYYQDSEVIIRIVKLSSGIYRKVTHRSSRTVRSRRAGMARGGLRNILCA